jgi:hypothetical protein
MVWDDGDKLIIESRVINNDKYSSYNDDYHTRKTNDTKKMFKFMKEYLKPFSYLEISARTRRLAEDKHNAWRVEPHRKLRDNMDIGREELSEIFMRLQEAGVLPVNQYMESIYNEAIPAYKEVKERNSREFDSVHVFFNPDDSIAMTMTKGENKGVYQFDTLDMCPQWVQEGVGLLKMAESSTHVPYIGIKTDDRNFWITPPVVEKQQS